MSVGYRYKPHTAGVNRVLFDSSGTVILSCADDGFVFLWHLKERRALARCEHPAAVKNVIWTITSEGVPSFVSLCFDGRVFLWELNGYHNARLLLEWRMVGIDQHCTITESSLAFDATRHTLVIAMGSVFQIWALHSEVSLQCDLEAVAPGPIISHVQFVPHTDTLLVFYKVPKVILGYNVAREQIERQIAVNHHIGSAALIDSKHVILYDLTTGLRLHEIGINKTTQTLKFILPIRRRLPVRLVTCGGRQLIWSTSEENVLYLWEVASANCLRVVHCEGGALLFS
ncbi:uncharacterized protein LAESUDRAFT_713660 [Laetiporus sulphureus 93-53]|uniref:Uncharacterized protein n=1 Tax=Laetiporus sulphureus 93-53 TaxID=1314785 RepID=A0A165EJ08_9APHY|nr:uncharacterized protein LAESUDRAFT_713660 [Laetiporus sulphureus 93-53]KZT07151.1 hypothetical protein LAESUDRAFT_713660 [Laetiporus sulphureus 93-53]